MKYLVDSQLILDALKGESSEGKRALALLEAHRADELILTPASYVALSPVFMGIQSVEDRFLDAFGIKVPKSAPTKVMDAAYSAWLRYQTGNSVMKGGMNAFDQLYIGAYALLYDGLLTSNGAFYRTYFDTLNIIES